MGNRERKEVRAQNNDPINVTCGGCMKVFACKEGNLECPNCGYAKPPARE